MRHPQAIAEENNWLGEGALTDAEVAEFTEVVEHQSSGSTSAGSVLANSLIEM